VWLPLPYERWRHTLQLPNIYKTTAVEILTVHCWYGFINYSAWYLQGNYEPAVCTCSCCLHLTTLTRPNTTLHTHRETGNSSQDTFTALILFESRLRPSGLMQTNCFRDRRHKPPALISTATASPSAWQRRLFIQQTVELYWQLDEWNR